MTLQEKNLIKSILQSQAWPAIEVLRLELIAKIQGQPKLKDTEWETLRTTIFIEGQVAGINQFINELLNTQK